MHQGQQEQINQKKEENKEGKKNFVLCLLLYRNKDTNKYKIKVVFILPSSFLMLLSGIVGIVSGGSSGLGAAAARSLLRHGAKVIVADLGHTKESFLSSVVAESSSVPLSSSTISNKDSHDIINMTRLVEGTTNIGTSSTICYYSNSKSNSHSNIANDDDNDNDNYNNENDNGTARLAFCETDVTKTEQISSALDFAEEIFGQSVNTAISCAGICPARKTLSKNKKEGTMMTDPTNDGGSTTTSRKQQFIAHPLDVFSNTLEVNVSGTFNLARLSAERMVQRQASIDDNDDESLLLNGCIINTASIAAYEGQRGQVAYAASKGAVVSMTLPMARDLAQFGIRVMTIVRGRKNL